MGDGMSDPIERAKADLSEIDRRIEALQAERNRIDEFIQMYERYVGESLVSEGFGVGERPKKERIGNEAESLVRRRGAPVPLGDIFDAVKGLGIQMGEGGEPRERQYLSSILNRDGRFQYVKRLGWDLRASKNAEGSDVETPSDDQSEGASASDNSDNIDKAGALSFSRVGQRPTEPSVSQRHNPSRGGSVPGKGG